MNTQLLSAVNEPLLFDVPKPQRTCKGCGALYTQVKCSEYCNRKCMTRYTAKLNAQRIEERAKVIQLFELPPLKPQTAEIQEMIALYRDKGVSFRAIAKIQGLSAASIRRRLIEAGVWRPNPKHQCKKGSGKSPNLGELTRLSRKTKKEAVKARRHQLAVCLWALRKGIGVETTCHANNWLESSVWGQLGKNAAYVRLRLKKTKSGSRKVAEGRGWISRQYRQESDFQNDVAKTLTEAGLRFERERRFTHSRDRVDFEVRGMFVECKINAKPNSFHRAMGQAFQAKILEMVEVCILVPDDVVVRPDQAQALREGGISLTTHSGLLGVLQGRNGKDPMAPTPTLIERRASRPCSISFARKPIKCRCCMEDNKQPSMSPSGSRRSWCVDCDLIIHTKEYDYREQRWVTKGWDV